MSAPPLPDIFGNYTLGDFVEVVSPEGVSWLPQTAGWYWLGAALLVLLARYGWRRIRRWHRNRYRREAIKRLDSVAHDSADDLPARLNTLLKLAAMAGFGRDTVASLTGDAWVAFLNAQCDPSPFDAQLAPYLVEGPYRATAVTDADRTRLIAASASWLAEHREPQRA
ncbi:MAG: DUF4381 domain-containing protein [Halioglobus sp.]